MAWNEVRTGLVLGMLMPVLGFFVYGLVHTNLVRPHLDMHYFIHELFIGTRQFRSPIISLSLIANLPLFFLLDRRRWYEAMRGVVLAMFIYAAVVVMLWI